MTNILWITFLKTISTGAGLVEPYHMFFSFKRSHANHNFNNLPALFQLTKDSMATYIPRFQPKILRSVGWFSQNSCNMTAVWQYISVHKWTMNLDSASIILVNCLSLCYLKKAETSENGSILQNNICLNCLNLTVRSANLNNGQVKFLQ